MSRSHRNRLSCLCFTFAVAITGCNSDDVATMAPPPPGSQATKPAEAPKRSSQSANPTDVKLQAN